MFCKNCGKELNENTNFCPYCGEKVYNDEAYVKVNLGYDSPKSNKICVKALVGFIVSLAGILLAALPCGIVGIIFSIMGKKEAEAKGLKGRGFAIAGIVVGIIDIAFGILAIIAAIAAIEFLSYYIGF